MIDPHNLPAGKMSKRFLEEWILFGICVASKPAVQTANKLHKLLKDLRREQKEGTTIGKSLSPFELVTAAEEKGTLLSMLKKHRVGQYRRIEKAFKMAPAIVSTKNPTIPELESVPGIGQKTARMIVLYYNPETLCAPLDTHILKFLRQQGYDAPKTTPSGRRYLELEAAFIKEAKKRRMTPFELDRKIWQQYAIA